MTTDLTTTEPTDLVPPAPAGYEGLDPSDFAPPWVSLCQALSEAVASDHAKAGQLYNSGTGEALDSMRVVFVHVHKERDLYDPDTQSKCRSRSYLEPDADITEPFAQTCATCSKQQWVDKRRECSDVFSTVAVDVDSGNVFKMSFKKTSYASFRSLLGYMASKRLDLFGASTLMGSKKATKGKNTYYVINFSDYQPISVEERERYAAIHNGLLTGALKTVSEGEEAPF